MPDQNFDFFQEGFMGGLEIPKEEEEKDKEKEKK